MPTTPSPTRYDKMIYNRCGRSGLKLPAISLGLWHNFGFDKSPDSMRAICRQAFDLGVTHFDLANNYGPPPGSAELAFGDDKVDIASLEKAFTKVAKSYGERKGISYSAWRQVGVSAPVLQQAKIARTRA